LARLVAQQAVAHPTRPQRGDGAGHEPLRRRERRRAREVDLSHVGDIEQPGTLAHRRVLLEDRGVLHRHLEAAELGQARSEAAVQLEEGGTPRLAHAPVRSQ
jgi:hypothetical protein